MIRVTRPRWSGPAESRDVTLALWFAAFFVTARIPMGFVALLVLPALVVLIHGLRRAARPPRPLHWLLAVTAITSLAGVVTTNPALLAGTGNSFIVVLMATLLAAAVFRGHREERASRSLFDGVHAGLVFSWMLGIFEAVSGFKFLPLLYPNANTAKAVASNRFFVTALFPNYNDFSVAMTILVCCALARLVFRSSSQLSRLGDWTVVLTATFFIGYMGSRGALAALLLGALTIAALSVRVVRPHAITSRMVFAGLTVGVLGLAALIASPWVQDNSTATRGIIFRKAREMMAADPVRALVGWGGNGEYQRVARARYGNTLMDPHNLMLEFVVWYGIPGLLCFLACWWVVTRRGVLGLRRNPGWRTVAACVVVFLYPLLGLVPSSTLRYHQVWLWLVLAFAGLSATRQRDQLVHQ